MPLLVPLHFRCRSSNLVVPGPADYWGFTLGGTLLDEWSAWSRCIYWQNTVPHLFKYITELLTYIHSFNTVSVQVKMADFLNYLHVFSAASVQVTTTKLLNYLHIFNTASVQVKMTAFLNYLHSFSTASVQVTMTEFLNYLHSFSTASVQVTMRYRIS